MPVILQWVVIVILVLLIYFGYCHGAIRHIRFYKVQVGMSKKDVRKLIGKPIKEQKQGHKLIATYNFHYANRLSAGTDVIVRIVFDNDKVVDIYR